MSIFNDPTPRPAPNRFGLGDQISVQRPGGKKGTVSQVGVTAPTIPGQTGGPTKKSETQLPFIVGAGQAILKALMTSGAGGIEVFDEAVKLGNNPLTNADRNVKALWGTGDLFDPNSGERVKTGSDVVTDTFGMKEEMLFVPKSVTDAIINSLATRIPGAKQLYGAAAAQSERPGEVPVGTNVFWSGLGLDIATDPLTYGTFGASIPFKFVGNAIREGSKAGRLAAAGERSAASALAKAGDEPVEILNQRVLGVSKKYNQPNLQRLRQTIVAADPKAAEVIKKAEQSIVANTYKTTKAPAARNLSEKSRDIVAAAVEGGMKAASNSYVSTINTRFLQEYAKRDVKGFFRRTLVANVARDVETGGWAVFSGNKVKLDTAATKEEAQRLAKIIQGRMDPMTELAPVSAITGARVVTQEGQEAAEGAAVVIPSADATEVRLEELVPHQADNGKVYVYDGESVAEFENIQDASAWVDIRTGVAPDRVPDLEPVVSGKSGAYQVRVGDRVNRFKTKREADAYAAAVRTGEIPVARRTTTGGTPILDTAPPTLPVKDLLKAPSNKEASALRAVLKGVDDIAKKTSGWKAEVSEATANQIKKALNPVQARIDAFLMKLTSGDLKAVKDFIDGELSAKELFGVLDSAGARGKQLSELIRTIPLQSAKGRISLGEALTKAKGNFLNLSKAVDGVEGTGLEAQAIRMLDVQVYKRAQQLKTGAVLPANTPEGQYQAIVSIAGEEVANSIRKTGYLTNRSAENEKKLNNILEGITSGNTEVSYQGYDDLIAGLRRGDEVSASALDEIFKLIDPEGGLRSQFEKASAEPAAAFLSRLLTREGGVNTIYEAERRLALAGDKEMLLKHSGLAYEVEVASLIKMLDGDMKPVADSVEFASTKQAHAESFAGYPRDVQADAMDSAGRSIMGDPKQAGAGGRQAYKASILEEATGGATTSTLGDKVYITGEAYADGSRAMFAKQLVQSNEVRIIGSLLGKMDYRKGTKAAKGVERLAPEEKLDWLIERLSAARDGLGGLGFRFVRVKTRDDIGFEKAYQAAIQKAKKTKTTPNFSANAAKHTAYLPMGDILQILKTNGGTDALLAGFFPKGVTNLKRDTMDWISLGDAARRVLEMDAAGELFDVNEIAVRLMRRSSVREIPSGRRVEIFKDAATRLAEVLTEPATVAQLKATHLDNAGSIVKDFVETAQNYSENLFDIMDEAWVAMHAMDNVSEAARVNAVRLFLRKFTMASDILRIEGGPIAEAMFRGAAMLFANGGKVVPEGKIAASLTAREKDFYNLLRNEEMVLFREALVKYYRYADIPTAPVGREGMPVPKKRAQEKVQLELDTVMELYAKHMDELKKIERSADPNLIKAWEKDMRRLQTRLDKVRADAWNNWLPTYHWHPTEGWQLTEKFNHAKATAEARQAHSAYVAGKRGLDERELIMADTAPVVPPHRILPRGEKAKFLKQFRVKSTNAQVEKAKSIVDDVAKNVLDEIEQGAMNLDELNGADKMMIASQNMAARAAKEQTEIRVMKVTSSYKDRLPVGDVEFNERYRPLLDPETPVLFGDRMAARLKLMGQRWAATSRGSNETMFVARGIENATTQVSSDYMAAMDDMVRTFNKATPDDMDAVWTAIRDDLSLGDDASQLVRDMRDALAPLVNTVLRSQADSVLVSEGIDGKMIGDMFKRYGLNEDVGFPSIDNLTYKTPDELVDALFDELPFGSIPSKYKSGEGQAIEWQKAREKFRRSELPMPLALSRMFTAIQHLKGEKGIATQLTAEFGWRNFFDNIEAAKAAGWVEIEASGPQNIARFLPDGANGGLFEPEIAESMGRVFREWNALYEGKQLPQFLNSAMKFMGFLKFTQTTARPGHHVVNVLGDSSSMLIFGGGKVGPSTMLDGSDIAGRFTQTNAAADYSQWGKDFEAKTRRLSGQLAEMPNAKMPTGPVADSIVFNFYRNGKPSGVPISRDKFAADLGARGALTPGFVQADVQGFANEMMLMGTTAGKRKALSKVWSVVARPGHEAMRGLSSVTAAYSNAIRATTAVRVAQSRVWSSYDEMMNAILKEVNLIHPTVQSLASSEKKFGRLVFTYYTWLRVAHNALWDMAINHTGALLAIPKAQYNYAQMQGFNPQSPAVPFENQNVLPDYLSYSVYGPTAMGPQGPRTFRPPLLLLDVLDFWKVWYDPSKSTSANLVTMGGQLASEVVGPSLNILGQPIAQAVFGTKSASADPLAEVVDGALSNFGFTNLMVGLGKHTPYRYRNPDATNQLTNEDRQRLFLNWITGAKAQDLYRPINVKIGQSQYNKRKTDYIERQRETSKARIQSFYDGKLNEGYSHEQIIEMLKQMGVK